MSKNTKSPKLTPYFPKHVKPVRDGVYPTEHCGLTGYTKWDDQEWKNQYRTIAEADMSFSRGDQNKLWRGLASDPKVAS